MMFIAVNVQAISLGFCAPFKITGLGIDRQVMQQRWQLHRYRYLSKVALSSSFFYTLQHP